MSIFNAFIIYLLDHIGIISYHGVKSITNYIDASKKARKKIVVEEVTTRRAKSTKTFIYDVIVLRHGPQNKLSLPRDHVFFVNNKIDPSVRNWEIGWCNEATDTERKVEMVSPYIRIIASTFVEALASTLLHYHKKENPSFRLTYDRFVKFGDTAFFQQVCRYGGTSTSGSTTTVGRVFPANFGIVGYAAMLGKPTLLSREDDFGDVASLMQSKCPSQKLEIRKELNSMLCLPIFYKEKHTGQRWVNSALYLDSSQKDFFTKDVIELIVNSFRGFIKNLERLNSNGEIKIARNAYLGVEPEGAIYDLTKYRSLSIGDEVIDPLISDQLCFETVSSFDVYA